MDVFDLFAKISLDSSEYESGLESALKTTKNVVGGVTATVAAVGTAAVAAGTALYSNVSAVAENGDAIDKASQKLGISAELYQELGYAAELSGTSIDSFSLGVKQITNDLADMQNGVEGASETYDALGVSMYDAQGNLKSTETLLMDSLTALADMEDETQRNALANDIFGRSYQELLPMLNSGSEGIASMMQEAEDYGTVMSDEAVKASASFEDALTQLTSTFDGVKNNLLSDFMPSITTIMDGLSDLLIGNENATAELTEGFMSAIDNIQTLIPRITDVFNAIIPAVAEVAPDILKSLIDSIIKVAPTILSSLGKVIPILISTILGELPTLLATLMEVAADATNTIAEMLPELIPEIIQTAIDLVTTFFENADLLVDAITALLEGMVDGIIAAMPILIDALPEIIGMVVNFLVSSVGQINGAINEMITAIIAALPTILESLNQFLPKLIVQIVTNLAKAMMDNYGIMIETYFDLFIALVDALPDIITTLVDALPEIIDGLVKGFQEAWPEIEQAGKDLLTRLTVGLLPKGREMSDAVNNIWDELKEHFEEKFDKMKEIGKNLIQGLINGITSMAGSVGTTISGMAGDIADGFKSFFGIASPSKLFKSFGGFLDEGLAIGIEDNADSVTDAMDGIQDDLSSFDTSWSTNGLSTSNASTSNVNSNITISLEGEMAKLFKAIVKENSAYTKSTGQSAFV